MSVSDISDPTGEKGKGSASVVAKDHSKMTLWMAATRPPITISLLSEEECSERIIFKLLDFTLPKSLFEIDAAVYTPLYADKLFITSVQASKSSVAVVDDDPFHVVYSLPALANTFDTCEQWKDGRANEATQSHPIVPLLNMAFRNGGRKPFHRIAREVEIRLAASGPSFPDKARLDFCTICASPLLLQAELLGIHQIPVHVLSDTHWQADPFGVLAVSLMLFPGEGKWDEHDRNKNQLMYDLSTGLHQQESLGLSLAENFGFVFANGVIRIYGMEKRTGDAGPSYKLLEYEFATFNIRKPLEFLKFYSFLCKLAAYLDTGVLKDFFELTPEKLKLHLDEHRSRASWRARNKSSHNQNPGWGGGGGGLGGGGLGGGGLGGFGRFGRRSDGPGGADPRTTHGTKRDSSMPPPQIPKKRKTGGSEAESDVGSYEADEFSPVPEFDGVPPDDGRPHEHSPSSTFSLQTPKPHWDEFLQPRKNACVPLSPWAGDACRKTKDQPVGQRSLPLSVSNLEAHTKREGSVDILSHTGMSTSSQS
ncbi:hypothetical protein OF83DRAFT_1175644 [Amylostereum chailletii]|nr:hypothetical protein OF83DRAFT_1175644 [Amylostereum chailletii]